MEARLIEHERPPVNSSLTTLSRSSLYPAYVDTDATQHLKQIYNNCHDQQEQIEKFILYVRGHADITSIHNAVTKGNDYYHHSNKPDFSLALKELDSEHLQKLNTYLEERINKTSYVSKHTLLENIPLTSAWLFLGWTVSTLYFPCLLGKLIYDQYQHEMLVQQRSAWVLMDIKQLEHYRRIEYNHIVSAQQNQSYSISTPSTFFHSPLQTYSMFNSIATAPPMTIEEPSYWSQQKPRE